MTGQMDGPKMKAFQADVDTRRSVDPNRIDRLVSAFRIVIFVGVVVAAVATLFFAESSPLSQVLVGMVAGVSAAVAARVFHWL